MQPTFNIKLKNPCTEDWHAMQPTGCGRHCAVCDKVVVDFSSMDKATIGRVLAARAGEAVCGNFRVSQLDETYEVPELQYSIIGRLQRSVAAALVVVPLLQIPAWAQQVAPQQTAIESRYTWPVRRIVVKGRIEWYTGREMPGISVFVNDRHMAISDSEGRFQLEVADPFCNDAVTLTVGDTSVATDHDSYEVSYIKKVTSDTLNFYEVVIVRKPVLIKVFRKALVDVDNPGARGQVEVECQPPTNYYGL
jgi:hypothetical protein